MAAYLILRHKVTGEIYNGRKLIDVDAMLCADLGCEPDPERWYADWMNWIGFMIAFKSDDTVADALAKMRDNARDDEVKLIDWFIDNFDNASCHRIG